jgi:hypothetical protein
MENSGQIFSDSAKKVAGVRHVLPGKIHISAFPAEIDNSKWEVSSFSYHKNTLRSIRFLEPSLSEHQSAEVKTLLSNISLITEILLD